MVAWVVAVADPARAAELIRAQAATQDDEVKIQGKD
jgi:hypothetical protein